MELCLAEEVSHSLQLSWSFVELNKVDVELKCFHQVLPQTLVVRWCTFYHEQELKVICPKHSCLVQNTFTFLNCTGSQEKGALYWATNELSMSTCSTVLWKDCRAATRQGNLVTVSAWEYSENHHLKLHCGHPEVDTIKDWQHSEHGFWGCVPQKIPSILPLHMPLCYEQF